jgi:hypothetical protein
VHAKDEKHDGYHGNPCLASIKVLVSEGRMRWAADVAQKFEKINTYRTLVRNPPLKRLLWISMKKIWG